MKNIVESFQELEYLHYVIMHCYITNTLKYKQIQEFETKIKNLRIKLDNFEINEENLLEIAAIKSKVQHFFTEILEDEDVLQIAYKNTF